MRLELELTESDHLGYYTTFEELFPGFVPYFHNLEKNNEIEINFSSHYEEDSQLDEAELATHEFFRKNSNQLMKILVEYLRKDQEYFMEFYGVYRETSYEVTNFKGKSSTMNSKHGFPVVEDLHEYINYFGVRAVYISRADENGKSYIGFSGGCTWDSEHGFGAAFHKLELLDVDDTGTGESLSWSHKTDDDVFMNKYMKHNLIESLPKRRERIAELSKSIVAINTEEYEEIFDWLVKHQMIYGYRNTSVDLNIKEKVAVLNDLERLHLRGNQFTEIPVSIKLLKNVTGLTFSFIPFDDFPKEILALRQLTGLTITHGKIKEIPAEIAQLRNLTSFSLFQNRIESLPEEIGALVNVNHIDVSHNKLSNLPKSLVNLENLTHLNLYQNQFTVLPDFIDKFQSLESLKLEYNRLSQLPESLFKKMSNLKILKIVGNSIPLQELTRIQKIIPEGLQTDVALATSLAEGELKRQRQKVSNEMRQRKQENVRKKVESQSEQWKQRKEQTQKYAEYKKQKEVAEAARLKQRKANKKWWQFWI